MIEQLPIAQRDVNPRAAIGPAGFDEQNAVASAGRKPVGQHASRRAATDDDEICLKRIVTICHARYRPDGGIFENRRSEEHTSELQSLMRISYAVFCLKKKKYVQ